MSSHPMVYEGLEGWLFLKGDTNVVTQQISGNYELPIDFERSWSELLKYRAERSKSLGYKYLLSIAPNKECVYKKFLPKSIQFSNNRPVYQILGADSNNQVLYLLEAFREFGAENFFNKTDTHWSSFGSILAFNALMRSIGLEDIPSDRFLRKTEQVKGDLGGKIGRSEHVAKYMLTAPKGRPTEHNKVENIGSRIVFENDDKSLPHCVVFHDSFTMSQLYFFPEKFSRVVYVWQPNLDYSIIESERPDFVISQQVERFLVECPDDFGGLSQKQNEARKKIEV
tara:strand:- start:4049 stop:4897 length:849 start_codon:yes stop_codon:yes gene_type:complete